MPTTILTFNNDINVSVQIGDVIYYSPTTVTGNFDTTTSMIELGTVTAISGNNITVNYTTGTTLPSAGDFIMFVKDRSVNMSSLLGYFAKFRIKNDSTDKSEMYSISIDASQSSK
tara:strand:+ start:341 stop:685 length:345 start_codon:yes stop_codon:yes gene_type:complete